MYINSKEELPNNEIDRFKIMATAGGFHDSFNTAVVYVSWMK